MTTNATLYAGPADAACRLLLAHGAGTPMDSAFLETITPLLAQRSIASTRFEFEYMARRRDGGKKKPPPRAERLVQEYASAIKQARRRIPPGQRLFIGGKSMGGRVASLIADEWYESGRVCGLVCLGYPFHPPNRPGQLRTAHLLAIRCPTLIVQGERDPFGTRAEVEAMALSPHIAFHWAGDGDHDLGPRGSSGFTRRGNLETAADAIATFLTSQR